MVKKLEHISIELRQKTFEIEYKFLISLNKGLLIKTKVKKIKKRKTSKNYDFFQNIVKTFI